jgi:prevent-host-death family protein
MKTVNIHDAKTNLSKLVDKVASSREALVIAKAGKPMVKLVPIDQPEAPKPRIGFMKGRIDVPANFDELARGEIEAMFGG